MPQNRRKRLEIKFGSRSIEYKKESRQNGAEPEQFTDVLKKYGCHYEVFQLNITGLLQPRRRGFWMDLESYGNPGHMDESISMFMKDENTLSLMNSN
jgi:hypothetical protein